MHAVLLSKEIEIGMMDILVDDNISITLPLNQGCRLYVEEKEGCSYSWYWRTENFLEWEQLSSSSEAFTIAPRMSMHDVEYRCEITSWGHLSQEYTATISWITFIVDSPSAIRLTPGETAQLSVEVNPRIAKDAVYVWQWRSNEGGKWKNVPKGNGGSLLTTGTFNRCYEGYQYRVVVKYGNARVFSKPITLDWNRILKNEIPDTVLVATAKEKLVLELADALDGKLECVWEVGSKENWRVVSKENTLVIKRRWIRADELAVRYRAKWIQGHSELFEETKQIRVMRGVKGERANSYPSLQSDNYVLVNSKTAEIIASKNEAERMSPNSCVKILTAILAIENLNLADHVEITDAVEEFAGIKGTNINLREHEILSIEDLLYALMLGSANDAANMLAYLISGGLDEFAEAMNKKAAELAMNSSHFVNPHGLFDESSYSTALDMSRLAAYAMRDQVFRKICSKEEHVIAETNLMPKRVIVNHNRLISDRDTYFLQPDGKMRALRYDNATGVKNGFTKQGKASLVAAARLGGEELICVLGNTDTKSRFIDAIKLFDYAAGQGLAACQ